jgi:hypothetical protein
MLSYTINWHVAPHDWKRFRVWHSLACPGDPLSAEERFIKEGGKIDNPAAKRKKQ